MSPGELTFEQLPGIDAVRDDWNRLAERSGNVFASWEWAHAWWSNLGQGRPLGLIGCRRADRDLVAILPFYLASTRPLRTLRLIGHGPGDELGPICAAEDREAVAAAIRPALAASGPRWDMLIADNLPRDDAWRAMGRVVTVSEIPDPVIEVSGQEWDDYLSSRSSKFRQQFRRDERRLGRDHGLRYRLVDDAERLDRDLDILFDLHGLRWGEESSGVFAAEQAAMQREFARAALARGWLRLWFMELDGKPAAARLGFRFGGVEFAYQAGRDRSWDRYGVGFVLQCHAIREAIAEGAREFRLLRGGEAYKDRFGGVDRGLVSLAIARGPRGRVALTASRAVLALPPSSRRWLSHLAGSR